MNDREHKNEKKRRKIANVKRNLCNLITAAIRKKKNENLKERKKFIDENRKIAKMNERNNVPNE